MSVIFLRSVSMSDFCNDNFCEDIIQDLDISLMDDICLISDEYDSIPNHYYGKDSWVSRTNIPCWTCYNKCPSQPWFVPININKIVKNGKEVDVIETYGTFCFATCVMSFIRRYPEKINNHWTSEMLLIRIYKEWIGDVVIIPESEDPFIKKCFIGESGITDKEYLIRNKNKIKNLSTKV